MKNRHLWLLGVICCTTLLLINSINAASTYKSADENKFDYSENLIEDDKVHPFIKHVITDKKSMALDPKYNKMLPMPHDDLISEEIAKKKQNTLNIIKEKLNKSSESNSKKPVTERTSTITVGGTKKTTIPLAEDLRFNKMLPEKNSLKENPNNKDSKKESDSDSEYDDYDDDYDEYYDQLYDENSSENKNGVKKDSTPKPIKEMKLKPIRGDDKDIPTKNDKDDYDDDDDDDDDNEDKEQAIYSNNVPCPKDCICVRNYKSEKVAACSRLDAATQKFGSDITDLVVTDVGPKYPIILGPLFFVNIGLKKLNSLKISNCTIELLHSSAFHGLNDLFSINLTNVNLKSIDPDIFVTNKHLRLLTISGNDLSSMTASRTKTKYLIKSDSIEELDLSNNKFKEIQPEAFIHLPNIVYINLAQNDLKTLPGNLFNSVETIEELDLSQNKITVLPPEIFNRTALARLDLKYNDIIGDLRFGTSDLQVLDLSYCSIKVINNHMFANMTGLLTLNLKGNSITKIQPDSFISLNYLRHIDLSFNNLEQVSSMLFYKNPNLDVIRLNDNAKLSELPPDGFASFTGIFNAYLLDISNCAINALGRNTFSQMPVLVTIKLSWNNINNMHKDTFQSLKQLTELDLSNNLIVKLDEAIFNNNKQLSKLNLSGNPIKAISTKLFKSNTKLRELDVSDCELHTILEDPYYYTPDNLKTSFFDSLKTLNVSFNKIDRISKKVLRQFKSLKTLSFDANPIKCNDEFKKLIQYLTQRNISSGKILEKSILEIPAKLPPHTIQGWDTVVQTVCRHEKEKHKKNPIGNRFDSAIDEEDDNEDDEPEIEKDIKLFEKTKKKLKTLEESKKILNTLKEEDDEKDKNNAAEEKESIENEDKNDADDEEDNDTDEDNDDDDDDEEENSKEAGEDEDEDNDDGDDDNDDEYDEEYDYNEENQSKSKGAPKKPAVLKDHGLFVNEVNVIEETNDKFLRGKLLTDDDLEDDGEIFIEQGRIYYENYKLLKITAISLIVFSLLLLLIAKIVSMVMRKRGERYRMAILANKNSIVYQKLSEDITKPANKNPKVHRYSRINQV